MTRLAAHELDRDSIESEVEAARDGRFAKTVNGSVVGMRNEFAFPANAHSERQGVDDLVALVVGSADGDAELG